MKQKFIRLPLGLPDDVVLAVAARRAGVSRAQMIALWVALLDHSSRQNNPGSLGGLDVEALSLQLELEPRQIDSALNALRGKKRLDSQQRIVGWDKYQSGSTRRVQAMRARRRQASGRAGAKQPPVKATAIDADTPAAIAARRARLQQNNRLLIGASTAAAPNNA